MVALLADPLTPLTSHAQMECAVAAEAGGLQGQLDPPLRKVGGQTCLFDPAKNAHV